MGGGDSPDRAVRPCGARPACRVGRPVAAGDVTRRTRVRAGETSAVHLGCCGPGAGGSGSGFRQRWAEGDSPGGGPCTGWGGLRWARRGIPGSAVPAQVGPGRPGAAASSGAAPGAPVSPPTLDRAGLSPAPWPLRPDEHRPGEPRDPGPASSPAGPGPGLPSAASARIPRPHSLGPTTWPCGFKLTVPARHGPAPDLSPPAPGTPARPAAGSAPVCGRAGPRGPRPSAGRWRPGCGRR